MEGKNVNLDYPLPAHVSPASRRHPSEPCPHCRGTLYWDWEDEEWCCLNCARRLPLGLKFGQARNETNQVDRLIAGIIPPAAPTKKVAQIRK